MKDVSIGISRFPEATKEVKAGSDRAFSVLYSLSRATGVQLLHLMAPSPISRQKWITRFRQADAISRET
jgi:hypothetical protein